MDLIKDLRAKSGLSQAQLAEKVPGVKPSHVAHWERGASLPPPKVVRKLASALGVESDYLFKEILGQHTHKLKTRMIKRYQAGSPEK